MRPHFSPITLTGRCFLLKPRPHAAPHLTAASSTSTPATPSLAQEVECVELTAAVSATSGGPHQSLSTPSSLAGNDYYTQRYSHRRGLAARASTGAALQFRSGDVVLRLCRSAVPRELAHKRVVDVTGLQTSFHAAAEYNSRALATTEEALQTMHLHDGHEVPALQRGDVDLVHLQPRCVYITTSPQHTSPPLAAPPSSSTGSDAATATVDLARLATALRPLLNAGAVLARTRRLSFRSDMEAVQAAQVMALEVADLGHGSTTPQTAAAVSLAALVRPVVRDGRVVGLTLQPPRGTHRPHRHR